MNNNWKITGKVGKYQEKQESNRKDLRAKGKHLEARVPKGILVLKNETLHISNTLELEEC